MKQEIELTPDEAKSLIGYALKKMMEESGAVIDPHRLDTEWRSVMTATGVRNSEREKERAVAYTFYNNRLAEAYASTKAAVDLALQFHDIGMTPDVQQRLSPLLQATIKAHMHPAPSTEEDKKPFEVKSVWYEYKGGDPTPIKHETDPGEIKGSLVVKNKFVVFTTTPSTITASEAAEKDPSLLGEAYKSNVATGIKDLPKIDLYNLPMAGKFPFENIEALTLLIVRKWNNSFKNNRPAVLRVWMNSVPGHHLGCLLKDYGIPVEPKERL